MYSGQTCTAPKRIFIHRSIYDEFLDRFEERAARLIVGEPEDERTDVSPLASGLAVTRIRAQLNDAMARGAKIVLGGGVEGSMIHPTIVRDATDDMLGMRAEVFGPVAFTSPFATKKEVLRRGEETPDGGRGPGFGGGG